MSELRDCSDSELLHLAQGVFDIPSLAAWRAAELKVLRHCAFTSPVLEIGNGCLSSLLLPRTGEGRESLYRRVACRDACRLRFADGVFATVFANCVLEHLPDLNRVLAESRRVLRAGGCLIATVPLNLIERHLWLRTTWYAKWRAGQLQHRHLLEENAWIDALRQVGFASVQATPFLSASLCELWDRVDAPLSVGAGPLTVGRAYRMGWRFLPASGQSKLNLKWQRYFVKALQANPFERPCAVLFQAWAPPPAADAATPQSAT